MWHGNMRLQRARRKHPAFTGHFPLMVAQIVSSCFEKIGTHPTHNTLTDNISQIGISKTPVYLQLRCSRFLW